MHQLQQDISIVDHESGDGFLLTATMTVPQPIDKVFEFFADAGNLETITPEFLNFKILSDLPIDMGVGALIDYRLQLYGIPFRWRTQISEWQPPFRFVDDQLRGPYRQWHHEHTFEEVPGGTLCSDFVHYKVPLGRLVNHFFVEPNVRKIFEYRQTRLREHFGN